MKKRLSFLERKKREKNEERAERELTWFFRSMGGKVPEPGGEGFERRAAVTIDGWLRSIPSFHRGAMALSFDPGEWPPALKKAFGSLTSLVVRLECAKLASGWGEVACELEAKAVRELEEIVGARDRRQERVKDRPRAEAVITVHDERVCRREDHAERYVELAIRAYAKARGDAHCVLPRDRKVRVEREEDLAGDASAEELSPAAVSATAPADATCVEAHAHAAG